jgi:hypothetical protein
MCFEISFVFSPIPFYWVHKNAVYLWKDFTMLAGMHGQLMFHIYGASVRELISYVTFNSENNEGVGTCITVCV